LAQFTPRALVYGDPDKAVYFRVLKDFLFKLGLRETTFISDPREIARFLYDAVWPIVFIDHSEGSTDAFAVFDGIYQTRGYELIPYVFLAPSDRVVYDLFGTSVGAKGLIRKPLQPQEAAKLIQTLIPAPNDATVALALQVSRLLLKGEVAKATPALAKLATVPAFQRHAEVALVRAEIRQGHMAQAHQRLNRLATLDEKDVRILCELADFYRKNSQFSNAVAIYKKIHALHPQMNIKIWDQILLHIDLDQLDEAALLLDELQSDVTFRDLSTEGLAKILHFMGMTQSVANILRSQLELQKQYMTYLNVQAQWKGQAS
jgi:tetratricopeptide (TPR) repeat protein